MNPSDTAATGTWALIAATGMSAILGTAAPAFMDIAAIAVTVGPGFTDTRPIVAIGGLDTVATVGVVSGYIVTAGVGETSPLDDVGVAMAFGTNARQS